MSGNNSFRLPHVFVLITAVIAVCAVATWILPSGRFERETLVLEGSSREVVVPGSYEPIEKHYSWKGLAIPDEEEGQASPSSLLDFVSAIPRGMREAAGVIFFIFLIGGTFGVLERTGVITATIQLLLERLSAFSGLLTAVIMVVLGVAGSTLGMGEEFIPLIPVFVVLAQRMGYDRIYAVAMVNLSAQIGFAAATTNPFTLGVAQGVADLPFTSGLSLRVVLFLVCIAVTIAYVLFYGRRIKRDPTQSLLADEQDDHVFDEVEETRFTKRHFWILAMGLGLFAMVIAGAIRLGWWFEEMSGGFFLMALLAARIGGLSLEEASSSFVRGMEQMVVAALVVGFAKGIEVVLSDAAVLDTVIHAATSVLEDVPRMIAAGGMLVLQTGLNFFIPSGSGQAAVTMPLMAPIADVLGITRQTAVLAFQCGDGFSNTVIPTSGILMSMLALARVPYQKWLRFALPLLGMLFLISLVFLMIAVAIDYN